MARGKRKTWPKSPEPKDIEIGRLIRAQRLLRGFSQTELANVIGVTFQQLQKYEKGVNRVGAGRLYRIADKLKVPVSFFFEGTAGPKKIADNINAWISDAAEKELQVRKFLEERGIVSVPDWVRHYTLRPTPEYLRNVVPFAAFFSRTTCAIGTG